MALPASVALALYRGDSRVWEDQFFTDGVPQDLTGYTFLAQIRATPSAEPMAQLDVTLVDAAAGKVRRTLTAEQAAGLVPGRAMWDFQVTSPDGSVRTVMAGAVVITADISQSSEPSVVTT